MMRVDVADGKYTVILDSGGLRALRWGEEWRDCCGDNLVLYLASELEDTRDALFRQQLKFNDLQTERDRLQKQCQDYALELLTLHSQINGEYK